MMVQAQRKQKIIGVVCALSSYTIATPAFSQAEAGAENAEDVIVVTAQRRAQDQRDVPFSVAELSGDRLDTIFAGGSDILALSTRVPSLYAESSNGRYAPRFYIRGLGNADFDFTASQPVSVVLDEIPLENVFLKGFPIFDVAQVEVLRGPQGTLFGRNTPAGVIKIDTVKPGTDLAANFSGTYGTFGSVRLDAGITVPVGERFSIRAAALLNTRGDWINNGNTNAAFAGSGDDMGGFRDIALRTHLQWQPDDQTTVLATAQYRTLDGTSTIFRANILDRGSNRINARYDPRTVFYDGGRNNFQTQRTASGALKIEHDFGPVTLTSISSYYHGSSTGLGDIDGGLVGNTPQTGFVPFPSESGTLSSDLNQYTQEVRLSAQNDRFGWQVGGLYFVEQFNIVSAAFNGLGNPAPTIVTDLSQRSKALAAFGQANFVIVDGLTLTSGLRYTDDKRRFNGARIVGPARVVSQRVSDSQLTWDASLLAELSDTVNVFARVARGYRGPSIQGRITFSNLVTTAESETVMSYEAGFKADLFDRRLKLNATAFAYNVDDLQLTAIGGAGNFNQLINAAKGTGRGFEIEAIARPTDTLMLTAGFSYNRTQIKDPNLLVAFCGAPCTVTDPIVQVGTTRRANINGNPFPQAPKTIGTATARYAIPLGTGAELYAFGDVAYQGKTNLFLYESVEFRSNANFELGLRLGYRDLDRGYEVAVFSRNLTNERNLVGAIDFNNLTGFVNDPRIIGIEFKVQAR
jgi:iron complex outermembrane receptor protein